MATPGGPDNLGFVDTNVLIYAFDLGDPAKQQLARGLMDRLLEDEVLVLSAQVLNEFYWGVTRPRRSHPLTHSDAAQKVEDLVTNAIIVPLTSELTVQAIQAVARHQLSYWDALIWAAAKAGGCQRVYSEDFQHGQSIDGVRFENPFA